MVHFVFMFSWKKIRAVLNIRITKYSIDYHIHVYIFEYYLNRAGMNFHVAEYTKYHSLDFWEASIFVLEGADFLKSLSFCSFSTMDSTGCASSGTTNCNFYRYNLLLTKWSIFRPSSGIRPVWQPWNQAGLMLYIYIIVIQSFIKGYG